MACCKFVNTMWPVFVLLSLTMSSQTVHSATLPLRQGVASRNNNGSETTVNNKDGLKLTFDVAKSQTGTESIPQSIQSDGYDVKLSEGKRKHAITTLRKIKSGLSTHDVKVMIENRRHNPQYETNYIKNTEQKDHTKQRLYYPKGDVIEMILPKHQRKTISENHRRTSKSREEHTAKTNPSNLPKFQLKQKTNKILRQSKGQLLVSENDTFLKSSPSNHVISKDAFEKAYRKLTPSKRQQVLQYIYGRQVANNVGFGKPKTSDIVDRLYKMKLSRKYPKHAFEILDGRPIVDYLLFPPVGAKQIDVGPNGANNVDVGSHSATNLDFVFGPSTLTNNVLPTTAINNGEKTSIAADMDVGNQSDKTTDVDSTTVVLSNSVVNNSRINTNRNLSSNREIGNSNLTNTISIIAAMIPTDLNSVRGSESDRNVQGDRIVSSLTENTTNRDALSINSSSVDSMYPYTERGNIGPTSDSVPETSLNENVAIDIRNRSGVPEPGDSVNSRKLLAKNLEIVGKDDAATESDSNNIHLGSNQPSDTTTETDTTRNLILPEAPINSYESVSENSSLLKSTNRLTGQQLLEPKTSLQDVTASPEIATESNSVPESTSFKATIPNSNITSTVTSINNETSVLKTTTPVNDSSLSKDLTSKPSSTSAYETTSVKPSSLQENQKIISNLEIPIKPEPVTTTESIISSDKSIKSDVLVNKIFDNSDTLSITESSMNQTRVRITPIPDLSSNKPSTSSSSTTTPTLNEELPMHSRRASTESFTWTDEINSTTRAAVPLASGDIDAEQYAPSIVNQTSFVESSVTSSSDKNVISSTLPDENLTLSTLPDENVTLTSLYNENVTSSTLPDENVTLTSRYYENVTLTSRYYENVSLASPNDGNMTLTSQYDENVKLTALNDENKTLTAQSDDNVTLKSMNDGNVKSTPLNGNTVTSTPLNDENVTLMTQPDENEIFLPRSDENGTSTSPLTSLDMSSTRTRTMIASNDHSPSTSSTIIQIAPGKLTTSTSKNTSTTSGSSVQTSSSDNTVSPTSQTYSINSQPTAHLDQPISNIGRTSLNAGGERNGLAVRAGGYEPSLSDVASDPLPVLAMLVQPTDSMLQSFTSRPATTSVRTSVTSPTTTSPTTTTTTTTTTSTSTRAAIPTTTVDWCYILCQVMQYCSPTCVGHVSSWNRK